MIRNMFTAAVIAVFTVIITACSDDPVQEPVLDEGYVECDGSSLISVFHVSVDPYLEWNTCDDALFLLRSQDGKISLRYTGSVVNTNTMHIPGRNGTAKCRMVLGRDGLPDGRYFVNVLGVGVPRFGRLLVEFSRNVGTVLDYKPVEYTDLEGSGTEDDPYIISGQADFLAMQWNLSEDKYARGYGLYFKQTASFDLPRRSEIIAGRSWLSVPFSGHYDGGGFELRGLAYIGGSDVTADSDVGLFASLLGGATIANVRLTGAILSNVRDRSALLAGSSCGDVSIENITVDGTVTGSGRGIGAIVGYAEDNLSVSRVTINNLVINGAESTGGILGRFEGNTLRITDVSTPNNIFTVNGTRSVGVVAGEIQATGAVELSALSLNHNVDAESSDAKVAYGSDANVGVVAGSLVCGDGSSLHDITIKCPVRGGDAVGALAGYLAVTGTLDIHGVLLASVVSGGQWVGGLVGQVRLSDSASAIKFSGDDNTTRFVIKESAAAGVKGTSTVGGLMGLVNGHSGSIEFGSKVQIAVNVGASTDCAGGAFGHLVETVIGDVSGLNFSSATMRVTAGGSYAGGIVGYNENARISGPNDFDLTRLIPSSSGLVPSYRGVVIAERNAGGVAGRSSGSIIGLACDASVTAKSEYGGGAVGEMSGGTLDRCAFFGDVSVGGSSALGGIASHVHHASTITSCVNYADLEGGHDQGGIVGYADYSDGNLLINYCLNKGFLNSGANVGGIVGKVGNSPHNVTTCEITNCGNHGYIKAHGDSKTSVGGIVGDGPGCNLIIAHCANHGQVSSSTVQYAIGGVAGHAGIDPPGVEAPSGAVRIYECMNSAAVSCDVASTKLGGIVGYLDNGDPSYDNTYIKDCYNYGPISDDQKDDTGGILGCADAHTNIARTFNRGKISYGNAIVGTHNGGCIFDHSDNYFLDGSGRSWPSATAVSPADIDKEEIYHSFDFTGVWDMSTDGPVLRRCPFQY